jgi:fumarate reductase subunit D
MLACFALSGLIPFAAIPPRVFVAVAPDLILAATVLIAIALPLMVLTVSIDPFAKGTPPETVEKIGQRLDKMRLEMIGSVAMALVAVLALILARALCLWTGLHGLKAAFIDRSVAGLAGIFVGLAACGVAVAALALLRYAGFVQTWLGPARRNAE